MFSKEESVSRESRPPLAILKPYIPLALAFVDDLRLFFAHADYMGERKRAIAREEADRTRNRFAWTLVIAAVRLAREENISRPSPRLMFVVVDCVSLAKLILQRVLQ